MDTGAKLAAGYTDIRLVCTRDSLPQDPLGDITGEPCVSGVPATGRLCWGHDPQQRVWLFIGFGGDLMVVMTDPNVIGRCGPVLSAGQADLDATVRAILDSAGRVEGLSPELAQHFADRTRELVAVG